MRKWVPVEEKRYQHHQISVIFPALNVKVETYIMRFRHTTQGLKYCCQSKCRNLNFTKILKILSLSTKILEKFTNYKNYQNYEFLL